MNWFDFPNPSIFLVRKRDISSETEFLLEFGDEDDLFVYVDQEIAGSEEIIVDDNFLNSYNPEWQNFRKQLEKTIILGKALPVTDDPIFAYKISFVESIDQPNNIGLHTINASSSPQKKIIPSKKNIKTVMFEENNIISQHVRQMNFVQAFEVGGFLRDQVVGNVSKDVDIAVCGETYESLVEKISASGLAYRIDPLDVHGQLIGVRIQADWAGPGGVEIALSRTEHSTGIKHQDFKVVTSPNIDIREDLARRDFTVNAIARNIVTGEIIDPFGGIRDANNKCLKIISESSFVDDPLRLLRGIVRVSKNDFWVEDATFRAMKNNASRLVEGVSQERIKEEFEKFLMGEHVLKALYLARDTSILQHSLPEFEQCIGFDQQNPHHDLNVDEHIFLVTENACKADADYIVRLAALFHDIGKPQAAWKGKDGYLHFGFNKTIENCPPSHENIGADIVRKVWTRWGGDNASKKKLTILVKNHMYQSDKDAAQKVLHKEEKLRMKARRWITHVGPEYVEDLMLLRRCDRAGKRQLLAGWDKDLKVWEQIVQEEMKNTPTLKSLAINGNDLLKMGFEGRNIGITLDKLLRRVIDQPEYNQVERLKSWATKMK